MIQGVVDTNLKAFAFFRVRGPHGSESSVDALIDSGFTASLTLPAATVAALGLARQSDGEAILADGSVRQFGIYDAEMLWEGHWRPVLAWAVGDAPLLGMQLMARHRLQIDVVPGGKVEIAPLP